MRILIVEDDASISSFISKGFEQEGFVTDNAGSAEQALPLLEQQRYDAAIIDIMLPGMDGLSLIETIRGSGISTPVLILSARQSVDDKVRGLQKGGDDYMVKPYSFSELLARVQALVRRAGLGSGNTELTLSEGDVSIDLMKREVRRSGTVVELQPKEFALLELFMRNSGNVISKTMILERVWDYQFDPQTNVVDVLVSRLRNKIDRNFDTQIIQTVRGVGYVLKIPQS